MPALLTYRTNDGTRWGTGLGSDLSATQIDLNFWTLFSSVQALEDHQQLLSEIAFLTVSGGNQLFVHMTDHRVLGPLTIPTAQWNYRSGGWQPTTAYGAFDVFSQNGSLYLVLTAHTSASVFSANATDGLGHNLYGLLIATENFFPPGGTVGQRLVHQAGSPLATAWVNEKIRIALYVEGQPSPNEELLRYLVVDHMTLPSGLVGSVASAEFPTLTTVSYSIFKNGSAIGSINFIGGSPSGGESASFGSDVTFVPGDIIRIVGPSSPDVAQNNISITLVGLLTE